MSKVDRTQIDRRVSALLGQMTLEEKLAQLGAYWVYDLQSDGKLDQVKIASKLRHGIGQITRNAGACTVLPLQAARSYNQLQQFLKEKTRLGIPAINHEECCAGLMAPGGSVFPQMIGLASTFQPELAGEMTSAIRAQMRAIGAQQGLAPVLDVGRDPRWGRIEETFGEDPTLVSQFGVAYIKGLQGEDLAGGVMATGKHFVGHSFSQGGLNCGPVHLGWRDLWDVYLAPFQAAIRDAGLASMMNAYPELDGEVVAASRRILTGLLRDTLGFDGLVVSDYEAVMMIHNYHQVVPSKREAAARALGAGIDVELPSVTCYGDDLLAALQAGEISMETMDLSVSRHLCKKFELGLFEDPYVDEGRVLEVFETADNRTLAFKIACQSLVLLKNDGLLPLKKEIKHLALIGPNADSRRCMLGDYSFTAVKELLQVVPAEGSAFVGLSTEELEDIYISVPTVLEQVKMLASTGTMVRHAKGCEIMSGDTSGFAQAIDLAEASDVVVMVMGGISGLAPQCTTGEFRDSTDLGLPGVQEELVQAVMAVGKPVVLVLLNGRPAAIPDLVDPLNSILQAWVPGEEGGRAVAATLFGDYNPGGKLSLSIPRSAGQVPIFYNHKPSGMRSNIYGDYVSEPVTPLFPFGHGLSYTTFNYSDLAISPEHARAGEVVEISLNLTNSGNKPGDEVVQLYTRDAYASMPRPVKELNGFKRLSLQPGETRRVTFHLPVNMQAFFDEELDLVVENGTIMVMVGSSSQDIRLGGQFEITQTAQIPLAERVFVCPVSLS